MADSPATSQQATSTTTEFRPTEGGGERTNNSVMLVAAYGAFWLLVLGFVAISWKRQMALSARLKKVERSLPGVEDNG